VPRTAASGPVAVALGDGTRSAASEDALVVDASTPVVPAGPVDIEVQRRKVFYDAERGAELSYVLGGTEPATVAVELVRAADAVVIARWTFPGVVPGIPGTVSWDGTAGRAVQRDGLYRFRVRAITASGAEASSPEPAQAALASEQGAADEAAEAGAFTFLRHRFPIAGDHTYATGAGMFGGGRGHQGEDVFAECGTPVVAARGGTVRFKQFEARAGNYVVVDGAGTGVDYAYMHLRDPALVDAGERVRTGRLIGFVGATGRADGCHLHFEMWSGPGWYRGGAPFDPLPELKAWDAES
ncbi:MAG TPA: M23 family metallopeptidase, partial [Solirubrobacteraceae bacterium]|nr:M23 family metallopeptidase [Solirubrobacteraceae bacterium]